MIKEELLNLFLQTNSLDKLTEAVSLSLNCPVIVADNGFNVVSSFAPIGTDSEVYLKTVSHSKLPDLLCEKIVNEAKFITVTDGAETYIADKLIFENAEIGYAVYLKKPKRSSDNENIIFADSLISKQFYSEKQSFGAPDDCAEEILLDLILGRFEDKATFKLRTSGTFLSNFSPERFALLKTDGDQNSLNFLRAEISDNFHASLSLKYKDGIIAFLHKDHDIGELKAIAKRNAASAVISDKLEDLYDLKRDYESVNIAFDYLKNRNKPAFFEFYSDCSLMVLFKRINDEIGFKDDKIRALCNYDAATGSELCLTLYTYFICGRSLNKTGEMLFTHRNTVQYRIKKIKEDFDIDPLDPSLYAKYFICSALESFKERKS